MRHHKGLFARRQHNVAFHKVRIAVLPCCLVSYVVKPDKYKPSVVHGLKNFHKFILGSHHLVIALLPGVSVKRIGGVYNQGVEEDRVTFFGSAARELVLSSSYPAIAALTCSSEA